MYGKGTKIERPFRNMQDLMETLQTQAVSFHHRFLPINNDAELGTTARHLMVRLSNCQARHCLYHVHPSNKSTRAVLDLNLNSFGSSLADYRAGLEKIEKVLNQLCEEVDESYETYQAIRGEELRNNNPEFDFAVI